MAAKRKSPAPRKGGKRQAEVLLKAGRVLEIYSDGQAEPWRRAVSIYPELKGSEGADDQIAADALLTWAAGTVASDDVKRAMAARVLQALAAIGFDAAGKAADRLSALKLLGLECGMFNNKVEFGGKIVIEKIQRVIVDPKSVDP